MVEYLMRMWLWLLCFGITSSTALAQLKIPKIDPTYMKQIAEIEGTGVANRPMILMIALVAITMLPFVGMMVTSFVKIAMVLSMTRQAIGTQQSPPSTVITGLSIILTVYVMHPVFLQMYHNAEKHMNYQNEQFFDKANIDVVFKAAEAASGPLKQFLVKQSTAKNVELFYRLAYRMRPAEVRSSLQRTDYIILIPAFVISELTRAFQIGFLIFLPFIVVDMAISNILMALGMQMLSPTTISLPFKILLFVMIDGWYLIAKGLVLGYQ